MIRRVAKMMRTDFKKILLDQQGAAVIVWCFFTISVFLYIVIAQLVVAEAGFLDGSSIAAAIRAVVWGLVLVDLGYLVWWKKRNLTRQALTDESNKTKILRALEEHQGQIERRAASVISAYVTRKIVVFAIIEAVAVYGLVLALAGRYLWDQYLLSGLSLVLLILEFPGKSVFVGLVNEIEAGR
jgi:hypothetical protein